MESQILQEIKELKAIFAKLIGISDPGVDNPFSIEAIAKAGAAFHKMNIERGAWIQDHKIRSIIKSAPYHNPGGFIREH